MHISLVLRLVVTNTGQQVINYPKREHGYGHVTLFPNTPFMLPFVMPWFVVVTAGQTAGITFTQRLFFWFLTLRGRTTPCYDHTEIWHRRA